MTDNKTLTLSTSPQKKNLLDFDVENLSKELFDDTAKKWAEKIAYKMDNMGNIQKDRYGNNEPTKNMPTQLRRFYDELVMWNERATMLDNDFQRDILPFVYMLKSKVAYAEGRGHVDKTFQQFINKLINQIHDKKTLNNAKLFMEAMMGFYKQCRPTK